MVEEHPHGETLVLVEGKRGTGAASRRIGHCPFPTGYFAALAPVPYVCSFARVRLAEDAGHNFPRKTGKYVPNCTASLTK